MLGSCCFSFLREMAVLSPSLTPEAPMLPPAWRSPGPSTDAASSGVGLEGRRDGFPLCPQTRVTLCCHSLQVRTLTLSFPPSPAMCGVVATIWFPVCAHRETTIMSFGYSLYTGWIGSALCLFGGCVIVCCSGDAQTFGENRFYYGSGSSSPTHAKSAHV